MLFKKDSYQAKIIVVGDSGVGKSSIIFSALQEEFKFDMPTTLGTQFRMKKAKSTKGIPLKLKMIDTAGQQKFKSITNQYYKGAHAAFIVFSLDSPQTFKNVKHWIRQIKMQAGDDVHKIIIANKFDLKQSRKVSEQQIKQLSQQTGLECIEVSAKTRQNIEKCIQTLTDKLVQIHNLQEDHSSRREQLGQSILLEQRKLSKNKKPCC